MEKEHPKTSDAQHETDSLRNLLQQQANEIGRLQKLYWDLQQEHGLLKNELELSRIGFKGDSSDTSA